MELGDRERLLRTHGRLAVSHLALGAVEAADARIAAFEALAAELKRALDGLARAGCCAPCGRRWRGASTRPSSWRPRRDEPERPPAIRSSTRSGPRTARGCCAPPSATTSWPPSTRRLPVARRASPGAVLAVAAIDHHRASAWSRRIRRACRWICCRKARLRRSTTCSRCCSSPRPRRWSGSAISRSGSTDRLRGLSGECSMLGMSYMSWEGPGLGCSAFWPSASDAGRRRGRISKRRVRSVAASSGAALCSRGPSTRYGRALLARGRAGRSERARSAARLGARGGRGAEHAGLGGVRRRAAWNRFDQSTRRTQPRPAPGVDAPPQPASARRWSCRSRSRSRASTGRFAARTADLPAQGQPGPAVSGAPVRETGREIHVLDLAGESAAGRRQRGGRYRGRGRAAR